MMYQRKVLRTERESCRGNGNGNGNGKNNGGTRKKGKKKPLPDNPVRILQKKIGDDLLSHTVSRAVPSALKSLTSVFGMGTGGSSSL